VKRQAKDLPIFAGQVFELVWAGHKRVKAYDLLSELSSRRSGVAPATVYRTLDFLQAQGLVHKLE
jgi:Fur family zinc uptake transcriptional regulator